uniref:Subtilisin-like seed-specific protein n=1 Tax=Solanum tuberosum TaxID=4113 RepID=M1DFM2_SOLTU
MNPFPDRLVDPLGSSGPIPLAGYRMLWQREVDRCTIPIALCDGCRYTGRVRLPQRIFSASVNARVLEFDHVGQEKSFNVTIKVLDADAVKDTYVFGELRWTDQVHYVRSPIAIASMSDISYMN